MPPRSAKRKPPARSKKSKQPEPQSNNLAVDENPTNESEMEQTPVLEENATIKLEEEGQVHELRLLPEPVVETVEFSSVAVEGSVGADDEIPMNESEIELTLPLEDNATIKMEETGYQVQEVGLPMVEAVDYSFAAGGSIGTVDENPTDKSEIELSMPLEENATIKLEEVGIQVQELGLPPHLAVEAVDLSSDAVEGSFGAIEGVNETVGAKEEPTAADTVMEDSAVADTVMEDGANDGYSIPEENFNNENEEKKDVEAGGEHYSAEAVPSDESQPALTPEMNSAEVETVATQINCVSDNILVSTEDFIGERQGEECDDDGVSNEDSEQDNEGDGDYEDPSLLDDTPLTGSKKDKNFEIYIGRLDKGTVEDDLIKIFGKFGELKSTRIVRNPTTKKSKGFAFVKFASSDHAKNALSELKDGVEVKGKHVKISASQENDTIYVGNICKTWSKEDVLGKLKEYGIGDFEEIHLPDDPKKDGKIKGFALLEFSTHSEAMEAFNRLRKPDASFGRDKSAKVAFTQSPMHPSEEVLSQVKRVYLDGLTKAWNEEKLKDICSQYGEIVKIDVNHSPGSKHRDFGFITFASREGALACVEGINKANIKEGEVEVKASMAKPQHKSRLQKQGFRGGFKVEKQIQGTPSKKESGTAKEDKLEANSHAKLKQAKGKGRASGEPKEKAIPTSSNVQKGTAKKTQDSIGGRKIETTSRSEKTNNKKRKKPTIVEDRSVRSTEHTRNRRPLKKQRGNERGKERNNTMNRNRDPRIRQGKNYGAESNKHRNRYATAYAVSPAYQVGNAHAASRSVLRGHDTDMEPHAGYLEPVAVNSGYTEVGSGTPLQPRAGYVEPSGGGQGQLHTTFHEHTVWSQPSSGYIQNVVPHVGYHQPVVVQQVQAYYAPVLRRAGGYDGQSGGYIYGGVRSTVQSVPASYIPAHTRYAGGQVAGNSQNVRAYPPTRTYY